MAKIKENVILKSILPINSLSSTNSRFKNQLNELISSKKAINCLPHTLQLIDFSNVAVHFTLRLFLEPRSRCSSDRYCHSSGI